MLTMVTARPCILARGSGGWEERGDGDDDDDDLYESPDGNAIRIQYDLPLRIAYATYRRRLRMQSGVAR